MFYLDRFLKKVCSTPMIYNSDEMFFFSRPTGYEVGKAIERVQRLNFSQKLEKIISMTEVNMELYTDEEVKSMDLKLSDFKAYCKKVEPQLKVFKRHLKNFLNVKKKNITNNTNFLQEI
mmetsp:Transcript_3238/g.3178  ORF Transcript_3238/g.3178 Transcript_3238/m.3178 type:complete len:119 (+) Transcript_3238:1056-1412(+)